MAQKINILAIVCTMLFLPVYSFANTGAGQQDPEVQLSELEENMSPALKAKWEKKKAKLQKKMDKKQAKWERKSKKPSIFNDLDRNLRLCLIFLLAAVIFSILHVAVGFIFWAFALVSALASAFFLVLWVMENA